MNTNREWPEFWTVESFEVFISDKSLTPEEFDKAQTIPIRTTVREYLNLTLTASKTAVQH